MKNKNIPDRVLVFDGAMGTMLLHKGLEPGASPELMNLKQPERVKEVHRAYVSAGADIITTNTFGGNRLKLSEYGLEDRVREINIKAVEIAREAAGEERCRVAASIGPTGQFVEPTGRLGFQKAYRVFREQADALADAGPDFILLETFSDLGEIRAAFLAVKDACSIPVICSLTFIGQRTLTGVSPAGAAVVLESMGAWAVGANCSGGPVELLKVVAEMVRNTGLPVMVQPNAGLPEIRDGEIYYPLDPDGFADAMKLYIGTGVNMVGSCCGSTPGHTALLKERFHRVVPAPRKTARGSVLAGRERIVRIGDKYLPRIAGERINPTARKNIAESLRRGDFGLIQEEAERQVNDRADLLDINVGIHGIDQAQTMGSLVNLLQQNIPVPFVIDAINPEVIEKGLQAYHGKALVNSVNGEESNLRRILPLVKRYGAGIIGLTLDQNGIPPEAEGRFAIARRIVEACMEYDIPIEDIYVDCLALTIGTDDRSAAETLKTLRMVKERLKVNTVLGISNVSHGLPGRSKINAAFLTMAIEAGLDLAIANPSDITVRDAWEAASLLAGRDEKAQNFLRYNSPGSQVTGMDISGDRQPDIELVNSMVVRGSRNITGVIERLLEQGIKPLEIINKGLIPGLNRVGDLFAGGEYYLPQLMLSAETAQRAFDLLEKQMVNRGVSLNRGTVVIGTVKGDIHDIGKNMVSIMLENHGFRVVDLGKSVPAEKFVEAVRKEKADFVGLSALMTTTMVEIPKTIKQLREAFPDIKVLVGGAVITGEFAREAGADGYGKDAVSAVKMIEKLRG